MHRCKLNNAGNSCLSFTRVAISHHEIVYIFHVEIVVAHGI